jgi:hypothetical protein
VRLNKEQRRIVSDIEQFGLRVVEVDSHSLFRFRVENSVGGQLLPFASTNMLSAFSLGLCVGSQLKTGQ